MPELTETSTQAADTAKSQTQSQTPPQPMSRAELIAAIDADRAAMTAAKTQSQTTQTAAPDGAAKDATAGASQGTQDASKTADATGGQDQVREAKIAAVMRAKRLAQEERERSQRDAEAKWTKERESLQTEAKSAKEILELLRSDPISAFRRAGLDPRGVFSKALENEKGLDPVETLRLELEEVKAERARERQAREEAEKAAEKKAREDALARELHETRSKFIQFVQGNDTKYPKLDAVYGAIPRELTALADSISAAYYERRGEYPTFEEICEYLETHEETGEKYERLVKRFSATSNQAAPAAGRANAVTLGSDATSVETGAIPLDKMTAEQRRKHIIESEIVERSRK